MDLQWLIGTFRHIKCNVLRGLPAHIVDACGKRRRTTLAASDVLRPITFPPCKLMTGSEFKDFEFDHRSNDCWIQAIELDPPTLGAVSTRYQLNCNPLEKWLSIMDNLIATITTKSQFEFSKLDAGAHARLPFPVRTYLEMPVVVQSSMLYHCRYYHY